MHIVFTFYLLIFIFSLKDLIISITNSFLNNARIRKYKITEKQIENMVFIIIELKIMLQIIQIIIIPKHPIIDVIKVFNSFLDKKTSLTKSLA